MHALRFGLMLGLMAAPFCPADGLRYFDDRPVFVDWRPLDPRAERRRARMRRKRRRGWA